MHLLVETQKPANRQGALARNGDLHPFPACQVHAVERVARGKPDKTPIDIDIAPATDKPARQIFQRTGLHIDGGHGAHAVRYPNHVAGTHRAHDVE
ncbi:hypothetical protein R80B4_02576 [Fibrobacteres bacterium R8-0-B4]